MSKILLIEDDAQHRSMIRQTLERAGHSVIEAENGISGVRLFRENPDCLIITDILMPDKDGIETILELRGAYPDVRIIAISGGGRNRHLEFLDVAGRLGAARTFSKPIDRKELLKAVEELTSPTQ